jgi:hypothetical protein
MNSITSNKRLRGFNRIGGTAAYRLEKEEHPEIDYAIQHAAEIATATAEMATKIVNPTCAPLPADLVQAIIDGSPVQVLAAIAKAPKGTVNDRAGGKRVTGTMTPLHMAALLYGYKRRNHRELEAARYDTICRILLREGANPLARAYLPGDSTPYFPAGFAKGLTPPSLRRRMLRETAENHVGWQPEDGRLRSINPTSQASKERYQRACTARGWVNQSKAAA